jgi:hypothetical protein
MSELQQQRLLLYQERARVELQIVKHRLKEQNLLSLHAGIELQIMESQIEELHLREQKELRFLEYCAGVRNNDQPFCIYELHEREHLELADALLERNALQRQWPSTCDPASACNA